MAESQFIPCIIERGGFSSERTFRIALPNGSELVGTADVEYLTDEDGNAIPDGQPEPGRPIRGRVQYRRLRSTHDGEVLIEVPSSDVVRLKTSQLVDMCHK